MATKGSHRQFKHPTKAGRVTIAGHPSDDLAPGTHVQQHPEAGGAQGVIMHRFLIIIEKAGTNFSAYSPDLPGCVATGSTREETREETERRMYEVIQLHVEGLLEDKLPVPASTSFAEYVVVPA
ncbi:MAG: type II toxin-antitoxin system HicA family toxin [Vicinamibacterales bacterium]